MFFLSVFRAKKLQHNFLFIIGFYKKNNDYNCYTKGAWCVYILFIHLSSFFILNPTFIIKLDKLDSEIYNDFRILKKKKNLQNKTQIFFKPVKTLRTFVFYHLEYIKLTLHCRSYKYIILNISTLFKKQMFQVKCHKLFVYFSPFVILSSFGLFLSQLYC